MPKLPPSDALRVAAPQGEIDSEAGLALPPAQPASPCKVVLASGSEVALGSLGLPAGLRQVLDELAGSDGGAITCEALRDRCRLAQELRDQLRGKTQEEREEAVALLGRLLQQGENGGLNYSYLPEKAQRFLRRWDLDGSGVIDIEELEAAANAQDAMKNRMWWLRRGFVSIIAILVLLLVGMFAMSFAASEMAKEWHVSADGKGPKIASLSGQTVQVASSDFEGTASGVLLARGAQACSSAAGDGETCEGVPVQVARATQGVDHLTSALADATFQELLRVELMHPAHANRTIELSVSSWNRVAARSSTCGSLVHLQTGHGRLTLDGWSLSADAPLAQYLRQAGFSDHLAGAAAGLGRRLQGADGTDGMLRGFFNLLRNLDQECMPAHLDPPEDLYRGFRATARVRAQVAGAPASALSAFFAGPAGEALPAPGFEVEWAGAVPREAYRVWSEEILSAPGMEAVGARSAMQPFLTEVRIDRHGAELSMVVDRATGMAFRCVASGAQEGGADADAPGGGARDQRLEFVALVEEAGMLLRHFRLHLTGAGGQQELNAMAAAGILPTHLDYYDVDTDPAGAREPGSPYRLVHSSTVEGSRAFQEKTYAALQPLEQTLTVEEALRALGVTSLAAPCGPAPGLDLVPAGVQDLLDEVPAIVAADSPDAPPPTFEPNAERGSSIWYSYDRLVKAKIEAIATGRTPEALAFAEAAPAWQAALAQDSKVFGPLLEAKVWDDDGAPAARRLDAPEGAPHRRLKTEDWEFDRKWWVTPEFGLAFSMTMRAGDAALEVYMEADQFNRVTNLTATAGGKADIWSPPTVQVEFSGNISNTGFNTTNVTGPIIAEFTTSFFTYKIGFGLSMGAVMNTTTGKLAEVFGTTYLRFGSLRAGATLAISPIGCGPSFYKRWEAGFNLFVSRESYWSMLRFKKEIPLFSKEFGGKSGC